MSKPKNVPTLVASYAPQAEQEMPAQAAPSKPTGKMQKVFVLTEHQNKQLKHFCADTGLTIQQAVMKGLDNLFVTNGLPLLSTDTDE